MKEKNTDSFDTHIFDRLYNTVKILRSPGGCPWDREQTPETLISSLIEEVYETTEAILNKDNKGIIEELGDLFLVLDMIISIYEEKGLFKYHNVLEDVLKKIIRRHPHVFENITLNTSEEVVKHWEHIKRTVEKQKSSSLSIFQNIPSSAPPLERAFLIQKKVQKYGFDWPSEKELLVKVQEEILEYQEADTENEKIEELGDLLFSIINLCRLNNIEPSIALNRTNNKFCKRFNYLEDNMKKSGYELKSENIELMEKYWQEAKKKIKD